MEYPVVKLTGRWVLLGVKRSGANNLNLTHLFSVQVEKARNDELKHWENDPKATLALIILQDQFLRSLYKVCDKYCVTDRFIYQPNEPHQMNERECEGMHMRINKQTN